MTQQILVQYDNSEEAMYGDAYGIDTQASEAKFEDKLHKALSFAFPGADIEITTGSGKYMVDGETDTAEAEHVGAVLNKMWERFDWIVEL